MVQTIRTAISEAFVIIGEEGKSGEIRLGLIKELGPFFFVDHLLRRPLIVIKMRGILAPSIRRSLHLPFTLYAKWD